MELHQRRSRLTTLMSISHQKLLPVSYHLFTIFTNLNFGIGEENLIERIGRMATTNPLWVDVTWGAGGSTFDKTLDICGHIT